MDTNELKYFIEVLCEIVEFLAGGPPKVSSRHLQIVDANRWLPFNEFFRCNYCIIASDH